MRVRYAPSPTGYQHLGGIRTALINYLLAKSQQGVFILRIEDTDQSRCKDEYQEDILDSLRWLGIVPDEYLDKGKHAPYIQSHRLLRYTEVAQTLLDTGHAYRCYTSSLERDEKYDRSSRDLGPDAIANYKKQEAEGKIQSVVRLKLPLEGRMEYSDALLGAITREYKDVIVDPIIIKSDGNPTYHLANVVDDHDMEITHVYRSQEWIPSTPVHLYIYKALGWTAPAFAHLPMVLGEDGQKLSKRNGSLSVRETKEMGILPEALINYVVLLGWSFDDSREYFTRDELIQNFSAGKIQKSPAKFSMQKLKWFNAQYIKTLDQTVLAKLVLEQIHRSFNREQNEEELAKIRTMLPHITERMELLSDASDLLKPLYLREDMTELGLKQKEIEAFPEGFALARSILAEGQYRDSDELEQRMREESKEKNLRLGNVLMPLRMAVTGKRVSVPILPLLLLLDKEELMQRLDSFHTLLQNMERTDANKS